MIASELISKIVSPLKTSDSGEDALAIMHINHVKHLPIVNDTMLLGVISEDDILSHDLNEPIGSYSLSLIRPFAYEWEHLFEVMSKMALNKLTVVPVIDEHEIFKGLITQNDLLQYYASSFSFTEPGSIIILEMNRIQYSLAEISRIIEGENASILSCFLTSAEDSTLVTVTIKVNKQNISSILASLTRYDYYIKGSFTEKEFVDELKERYDSLMSYLNV